MRMQIFALALAALFTFSCGSKQPSQVAEEPQATGHVDTEDDLMHGDHEAEAVIAMSNPQAHLGPHFRWTTLRPTNQADQATAWDFLRHLRQDLAPFREYRFAEDEGYETFLPNVRQTHYHFTRKTNGFKATFKFDPTQPTSLLYRDAPGGYELEGAMFTAPKWASEDDLNKRIPLSVAQWHAHVNICLPQKKDLQHADWKKFGPKGSILTKAECDQANGRFHPQLFGWMVHVYPYAETPEQIWAH